MGERTGQSISLVSQTKGPQAGQARPYLYIDLRFLLVPGVYLLLFLPPFLKGLFFAPDLLPAHMFTAVLFALHWLNRLNRRALDLSLEPMDWAAFLLPLAYLLSFFVAVDRRAALGEFLKYLNYFLIYWLVQDLVQEGGQQLLKAKASRPSSSSLRDSPSSLALPARGVSGSGPKEPTGSRAAKIFPAITAVQLPSVRRVLQVIFLSAFGVAAIGLAAAAGYIKFPGAFESGRIMSTLQYPNALAAFIMVASLIGLALWAEARGFLWPALYATGLYLFLLTILGTLSRGGWIIFPLAFLLWLVALPTGYFWRSLYNLLATGGVAILIGRAFLPRVTAGQGAGAGKWLLLGLVLAVGVELLYRFLRWVVEEHLENPLYRNVFVGSLILYAVLLASLYAFYLGSATPSLADEFFPARVVDRAETIGTYDTSFEGRLIYTLDALRLVRRHPLLGTGGGGWNALYHQYQSLLYWTTEIHNHFAQVLVETGLLGLGLYLWLWGAFFQRLYRLWRQWGPGRRRRGLGFPGDGLAAYWSLLWGAAVAAVALGVHSAFDFDLSLPALSFILWALFGLVRAQPLPARLTPGSQVAAATDLAGSAGNFSGGADLNAEGKLRGKTHPDSAPSWPVSWSRLSVSWRRLCASWSRHSVSGSRLSARQYLFRLLAAVLLPALVSIALFYPAYRLNRAGLAGAAGAQALQSRDAAAAERYLAQAHQLDPYTSTYLADLAQLYTAAGRQTGEEKYLQQGNALAHLAARVQPYNLTVQQFLVNLYLVQGKMEDMVAQAEWVSRLLPLDLRAYEGLARTYLLAAETAISQHHQEISGEYLKKILGLPEQIQANFVYLRRQHFFRDAYRPPVITGPLRLTLGQASVLLGDPRGALTHLQEAARTAEVRPQALLWQALAWEQLGEKKKADNLRQEALKIKPELMDEYKRIRPLLP